MCCCSWRQSISLSLSIFLVQLLRCCGGTWHGVYQFRQPSAARRRVYTQCRYTRDYHHYYVIYYNCSPSCIALAHVQLFIIIFLMEPSLQMIDKISLLLLYRYLCAAVIKRLARNCCCRCTRHTSRVHYMISFYILYYHGRGRIWTDILRKISFREVDQEKIFLKLDCNNTIIKRTNNILLKYNTS